MPLSVGRWYILQLHEAISCTLKSWWSETALLRPFKSKDKIVGNFDGAAKVWKASDDSWWGRLILLNIFWITESEAFDPHDFIASQREVSNTANEY